MKFRKYFNRVGLGGCLFDILNYLFMIAFSASILYSIWNIVLLSFSTVIESQRLGVHLWNTTWVIDAYRYVFQNDDIGSAYMNTIFRTVMTTVFMLFTSLFAAYPLSKKDLPGRKHITLFFVIPMFFSGGLVPYYFLIRSLGLINSLWVYVIPNIVGIFNVLLTRNYLMSIDGGIEEAALIDGASYPTILLKIIAPLCKPVLATIALWTMVGQWNAWFDSLIFITDDKKIVLQLVIQRMLKLSLNLGKDLELFRRTMTEGQNLQVFASNVRAATILITIGPIILTYPFLQKYFIKGIMIGSLKG